MWMIWHGYEDNIKMDWINLAPVQTPVRLLWTRQAESVGSIKQAEVLESVGDYQVLEDSDL